MTFRVVTTINVKQTFAVQDLNNYLSTEKMEIRFGLLILKVVKKMDYAKTLLMLTWLILSFLALAITTVYVHFKILHI